MRTNVVSIAQNQTEPSSSSTTRIFREPIRLWKRAWLATQVIHRGKYSIERLLALEEYTRTTSFLRVLLLCGGTPLPIIVLVFSQEALPLEDPEGGWRANWGFWIRASMLGGSSALAVTVQLKYLMQGIGVSSLQLILLFLCVALGYTAASIMVASLWVFPLPYMVLVMTPPFLLILVGTVRVLLGKSTFRDILAKRQQLFRFVTAVNIQVLMAVCYPAYQLLFKSVAGSTYELPAFLLLPVMKLVLKNLVSLCLAELADAIPENIIFTVHFFNAIYLATCMQSSSSTFAVMTIILVDFLETMIALHGTYRSSKTIMKQLHSTLGTSSATDTLLAAACSLCHYHEKFTPEERAQVQVRSCFPHKLSLTSSDILAKLEVTTIHLGPRSSNTQSMPTMGSIHSAATGPSLFGVLFSRRWSAVIGPVVPMQSIPVAFVNTNQSRNQVTVAAVPSVQHIATLRKTLAVMFTIECIVLAEYVEFIIPFLYGSYVLMMVRLPSAKYHTELTGVDEENAGSTVQTVFAYGLLELGSFVLLVVLLKRRCGMQALYHLAFVLENQMLTIQSKIIGWMLITLGFRIVHFGVDFTFRFAWIRDQQK